MKNLFFTFITLLTLFSCAKTTSQPTENIEVIKMSKTSCRGKCPQYSIVIYNSKKAVLEAKSNLEMKGKYALELSDAQYNELVKAFEDSDFTSFDKEYTSKVTDLPTTYISFLANDALYTIKDYHGAPEKLKELEKKVSNLLEMEGWEKTDI
ncbi:DUF6438 domain-containing protein [Flammeovirga aprica]|uniref:DUF6438 domain-containing protein n=1 Tax=Flammeovirga aprica JL-4 TaxID=694437 RepID=A0A7X9P174_9BACT|nr:DUF6438 domain-containing protein [Flammeovirga aprica]NME67643.1 hypothetical protein [Flammeovirga aprica JL-4]